MSISSATFIVNKYFCVRFVMRNVVGNDIKLWQNFQENCTFKFV